MLNKTYRGLARICLRNSETSCDTTDSVVLLAATGVEHVQFFINQTGLQINVGENYLVDGESEGMEIQLMSFKDVSFVLRGVKYFWNDTRDYLLGMELRTDKDNLFFRLLSDEIINEDEEEFWSKLKGVSFIEEKLS